MSCRSNEIERFGVSYPQNLQIAVEGQLPPCSVLVSLIPYFVDGPVKVIPPDPWAGPQPGDPPFVDPTMFLRVALGGAIVALAAEREKLIEFDPHEAAGVVVRVAGEGITKGLHGLGVELGRYAEGLGRLAHGLKQDAAR